jgi:hypothetical protein
MSKRKRLQSIEKAVAERVAALKNELDQDPAGPERRRKKRALQAAEDRARRVERTQQKLAELVQEQAEKGEPKVSVSDPEARFMRLADGAAAPAWNGRWRPPMASSWRSIQRVGARTADWRRAWWRRLPSVVAGCRNGCWPTPRR